MKRLDWLAITAALAIGAVLGGCNMFGGIDSAKSRDELIADAQARMDAGDCAGAVEKLNSIGEKDSRTYQVLGWAQMCQAGATINKIGKTLFSYSSSSNNLTVVGTLANSLVPSTADSVTKIAAAVTSFGLMDTGNEKAISQALSNIVKAATIIAKASGDSASVRRGDIAPSASCLNATCSSAPAACAGGMSDADANAAGTALAAASTAVGGTSGLDQIKDLANQLGQNTSASSASFTRCTIYNSMLTQ